MTIDTNWDADLDAMVADLPTALVWSGQTVSGTASPITRSDDVDMTGILLVSELEWVGPIVQFTDSTPLQIRDVVAVGGVNYHVTGRQIDSAGVRLTLRRV